MIRAVEGFTVDFPEPTECSVKGSIPRWVRGSLIRDGPAKYRFGPDEAVHLFDGLAVIHRFSVEDGRVSYHNRLLNSDTYRRNEAANRIVVSEFGTVAAPDPCRSIFTRYFTYFFDSLKTTDNDCVNVMALGDQIYAMTETTLMNKVDAQSLETLGQADWGSYVAVHMATAHPLRDQDGTTYNLGTSMGGQSYYNFIKIPPSPPGTPNPLETMSLIGRLKTQWPRTPNYCHSFGLTENYLIFVEQPVWMDFRKRVSGALVGGYPDNILEFQPNLETKIHLLDKRTGERLNTEYRGPSLFTFHHINAFEDGDHLVMDLICFDDVAIIKALTLKELRKDIGTPCGAFTRFVLPLNPKKSANDGESLVNLPDSCASATLRDDGTVFCKPEVHKDWEYELPRINEKYLGRKYRYSYGVLMKSTALNQLLKVDVERKKVSRWELESHMPGEPIFLPAPDAKDEDDGVLLSPVISYAEGQPSFLLVMDAKSFTELGRAEIPKHIKVPLTFHGLFAEKPA